VTRLEQLVQQSASDRVHDGIEGKQIDLSRVVRPEVSIHPG